MKIDVLTLFPEMFTGVFASSMLRKAQQQGHVTLSAVNFREYADDRHMSVDDTPYGGGAGMVLKPEPIVRAVEALTRTDESATTKIVLMSPQGQPYTQAMAARLARESRLLFICGHYEGFDERIRQYLDCEEISIGDYVLTGGEIPAMAVIDSVVRLLPGVLGNDRSAVEDSFANGRLEHPQYTRPPEFRGMKVPEVLQSGHHARIDAWRRKQALLRTYKRRPDLLRQWPPSAEEQKWLQQFENDE